MAFFMMTSVIVNIFLCRKGGLGKLTDSSAYNSPVPKKNFHDQLEKVIEDNSNAYEPPRRFDAQLEPPRVTVNTENQYLECLGVEENREYGKIKK